MDAKELRGFNHIDTAVLLCPMSLLEQFEAYPNGFMERVEEGSIKITAGEFPAFMYASNTVFHPKKEFEGLFQGYLLVRVYRHIFTGPSTALVPARKLSSTCKARKFGLKRVTGRTIAYACVQARFALSSMSSWTTWDGIFSYEEFYDSIVNLFEYNPGPKHPWVIETLKWWNDQVPGLNSGTTSHRKKNQCPTDHPQTGPTSAQRIAAQIASAQNEEAATDVEGDRMYAEIAANAHDNKLRAWFASRAQDRANNRQQPDHADEAIIPTEPTLDINQQQPDHSDQAITLNQPPTQPRQQESEPAERDAIRAQEAISNQTVVQEVARADQVPSVRTALGIPQARQAHDPESESELSAAPGTPIPIPPTSRKRPATWNVTATSKKQTAAKPPKRSRR